MVCHFQEKEKKMEQHEEIDVQSNFNLITSSCVFPVFSYGETHFFGLDNLSYQQPCS